jgi:acyl-CoA synthetase (AMP-forming)/AMP-acid ligase II
MSGFTETMFRNAAWSLNGITTGEPRARIRHLWVDVHARAARIAGGLASANVGHGDAVAVLVGDPYEIAPAAQGIWMRGASVTMLHQPTERTDLLQWATDCVSVATMIDAKAVVVSDPFLAAAPMLAQLGMRVLAIADLLLHSPVPPVDTADDDVALLQLTSGSTGSPKAVRVTHRNVESDAEAMFADANFDMNADVIVGWPLCFQDMGMTRFLTVPMYLGAELITLTPMDAQGFKSLWPKPIDNCEAAMTVKTNAAVSLGPLDGPQARAVDDDGSPLPPRAVGVLQVREEPVTDGHTTEFRSVAAQDETCWHKTGDLGYLTDDGTIVVCGRIKDGIVVAGRNIDAADVGRAASRVDGVRPGGAVAILRHAGFSREVFAVAVESKAFGNRTEVRRIERQVAQQVAAEVNVRPRDVKVLKPGAIPKTSTGELPRTYAVDLIV